MGNQIQKHHHHILPTKTALTIGGLLLFLTVVTVWIAGVDLGKLNFVIAMAVATCKALLVALFFMNLIYDKRENGVIFATSFLFLAIFIVLTGTDMFFRGDVYVKGPLMAESKSTSKLSKPWISTPQLVAHGKELFAIQCASCHGVNGGGDGPAAAALTPRPRDFTAPQGWKNGRKPTIVFKTLKEGLPGSAMASYATLPSDDRWALVHYVLSLAPNPESDTAADFAKIGIDPTQEGGGEKQAASIPVEVAMMRLTVPETRSEVDAQHYSPGMRNSEVSASVPGARLYNQYCLECHGPQGQGGIKVVTLKSRPTAYVTSEAFKRSMSSLQSQENFKGIVTRGYPGNIMPGFGSFSEGELTELYRFVTGLAQ